MKRFQLVNLMMSVVLAFVCFSTISAKTLRGKVSIDGSSTVFPITEAIAEEFRTVAPRVKVNIGVSGTGGGFKKFLNNETDINNASRRIKSKEVKIARAKNIEYLELPIAYDGITVVVNPQNTWAKEITTAELKMIWDRESKVTHWNQIRKSWPHVKIKLYGPGTDSGTFDYSTKAINGKSGRCRSDYQKSEDDNVLVKGVAGDKGAMGFFGYAYYKENKGMLKALMVDNGTGEVMPNETTINNSSYKPLSRPMYLYIRKDALSRTAVRKFVQFYLEEAKNLVGEVGYVSMPLEEYQKSVRSL